MILEGNSVRSIERLTEVHRNTIIDLMVEAGELCELFLAKSIRDVPTTDVQGDEIWGFCHCKQKTAERNGYGDLVGDVWTFVGIDRESKLVLAYHVGKRSQEDTIAFTLKLKAATTGHFQLSTDGYPSYNSVVPVVFGPSIDYAQLVKEFTNSNEVGTAARYSPGKVIRTHKVVIIGNPDQDRVCTTHVERSNLSMRTSIRRMTRLTIAHSKKWRNHQAAIGLWFAYYNYCRAHTTLTQETREENEKPVPTTPAMKAGLAEKPWSVSELLNATAV
jgi:IS1 family transposase